MIRFIPTRPRSIGVNYIAQLPEAHPHNRRPWPKALMQFDRRHRTQAYPNRRL